MLMIPAAEQSITAIVLVAAAFSVVTIATMIGCVLVAYLGFELFEFKFLHRYMHALSGLTICGSGILILLVGA